MIKTQPLRMLTPSGKMWRLFPGNILPFRRCSPVVGVDRGDEPFLVPRADGVEVVGGRRPLPVIGGAVDQLFLTQFRVANLVGLASVAILLQGILGGVRNAKEFA